MVQFTSWSSAGSPGELGLGPLGGARVKAWHGDGCCVPSPSTDAPSPVPRR